MTSLPIVTFHAIEDAPDALSFSPWAFERGIAQLRERGYRTLTLGEVAARAEFPERTIVLTFDDGFYSVYAAAFPILRRYGMTATVFVMTRETRRGRLPMLNGRAMLSWDEMREMQNAGIEIGAHTLTHPDLTQLPLADVEHEMRRSKEMIQDTLGEPVKTFAYPFGRHNASVREIARENFVCAVTDDLGLARSGRDRYALARVEAYYLRRAKSFALFGTPWLSAYLRLCNVPRRARRVFLSRGMPCRMK